MYILNFPKPQLDFRFWHYRRRRQRNVHFFHFSHPPQFISNLDVRMGNLVGPNFLWSINLFLHLAGLHRFRSLDIPTAVPALSAPQATSMSPIPMCPYDYHDSGRHQ